MFEFLKYKSLPALLSVMLVAPVLCDLHGQMRESFNHLSVNEGLSQSTIYAITQDSKGFLWFGTRGGGLNRYDGYEFKVFRNNQDMPGSLSDDEVTSILEDSHGTLWIGTRNGGLNRYDLSSGKFTRYLSGEGKEDELKGSGTVRCIYEDRAGRLWVGMNHKVCLYERNEDRFDPILNDAPIPVKGTTGICEDSEGRLYFATWDRLIQYDTESNTFNELYIPEDPFSEFGGRITPVLMDRNDRLWLGTPAGLKIVNVTESFQYADASIPGLDWPESFSYIRTITEAKDGMIWFGTGQGLYALDPDQGMLKSYHTEANNPLSLVHNSVYSVFEDMVGTLWIGTWSGISVLDKRKYNFTHFSHMYNDPRSLSNNLVSSFQEDRLGTWIGTEQGGLNFMNKERTNFVAFQYSEDDPQSLPTNNVKSIFLDSNQDLWVGTFRGGLSLHLGAGKFKHFLTGHSVFDISEMPEGTLWIGCSTGLYTMNLKSREIKREVFPPSVGSRALESFITVLHPDLDKRMWIGTKYDGLYLFDSHRASLKHFKSAGADSTSLSGDYVISICESPSSGIWIGTNSGLNRYRETSMSFERFRSRIGIEDNVINGLLPDNKGRLWISTNTGIYLYNAESGGELRHYDYLDGLQSNEFNRGSCYQNSAGEMFFGGVSGFNVFFPDEIKSNPDKPPVIITDLKLFNESVVPGGKNSPLEKHVSETKKIILTHRQSSFSLDFVALNFLNPEKNNYEYILEGYETQWNRAGRSRTAAYMNLSPGNYTFRARASNNDNVWNEEGASIMIEVKGPYWASPLAIIIYVIVLVGLLLTLMRLVSFRARKENELNLERAEKDRLRELNRMRLQYFTNISHEFRTPLTLITGPLDKLMSGKYEKQKDYLFGLMKNNVNRMLRLVNQLMDFRKLENDKMILRVRPGDLDDFLSQIILGFEDLASKKMIELKYVTDSVSPEGAGQWFDEGIIDKVAYNLLSNAFKFTPEQGVIEVSLSLEDQMARMVFKDTGKGIAPDKVNRIFERFYSDGPEVYAGTGIGLSLSKRLIDLHRGNIVVESEKGKGATFIVTIPIAREKFSPDEIFDDSENYIYDRPELDLGHTQAFLSGTVGEPGKSGKTILIAEDNPELSAYLADHFSDYNVMLTSNGREALELAKKQIPDVIISDIMMPEMDGLEFCGRIKQDFLTNHIPVILLTAKSAVEQKIEGMESGADAYLEKPFDAEYLSVLVKNLLTQRKKLRQKFSGQEDPLVNSESGGAMEEIFLKKVNAVVQDHIGDPAFAVEQLLEELGMSRSQLYRKFKAISDRNPSEYIRILRLQYATSLIRKNEYTISEVAFMSGFGNASYFTTCFKRHYGISPGKYFTSDAVN